MPVSMLSTSLLSDRKSYSRFNALDTIYTPPQTPGPGMVLMKPTSIAHSGTSATLGTNGQVTFNAVTSLSLNGVFSADFDNYVLSIRGIDSGIYLRMRSSGADATGSDYTRQYLDATGTSINAGRQTSQNSGFLVTLGSTPLGGATTDLYGPYLSQPTVFRSNGIAGVSDAYLEMNACTHSLSTSYDGCTLISAVNSTGAVQVYGVRS